MSGGVMVFRDVVAMISTLTAKDAATCESFLSEFFSFLSEQLDKGETVQIKHFGTFSVTKDGIVVFAADKEVADALNAAFECFEPVEIKDGLSDRDLEVTGAHGKLQPPPVPEADCKADDDSVTAKIESEASQESVPYSVEGDVSATLSSEEKDITDNSSFAESSSDKPLEIASDGGECKISGQNELDEEVPDDDAGEPIQVRHSRFWLGYAFGVATAVVVGLIAYFLPRVINFNEAEQEQRLVELQDSINQARARLLQVDIQEQAQDSLPEPSLRKSQSSDYVPNNADKGEGKSELAKYKVTSSTHLSSLARKYYGHYSFWVYIYMENKSKIKNPDNLPVGVTLIIPLPQKYGINSHDPESIRKAKALEKEIKSKS